MNKDFTPFRDYRSGPEGGAGRLLERVEPGEPWPLDRQAAVFWAVRQRTAIGPRRLTARPRRPLLAVGLTAAAAVGLLLVGAATLLKPAPAASPTAASTGATASPSTAMAPVDAAAPGFDLASADPTAWTRWRRFDLEDLGCIDTRVEEGFELRELPLERQLRLARGILRAHVVPQDPARPVVVLTPHLSVVVVGTRFDVESTAEWTRVQVLEGRVRVERGTAALLVEGGMSVRSDDPALNPPRPASPAVTPAGPPAPSFDRRTPTTTSHPHNPAAPSAPSEISAGEEPAAAPTLASCRGLKPGLAQKRCYDRIARGDGLAAQNALFALGEIAIAEGHTAEAVEQFRVYTERFPEGVLAPEAALGLLELLKDHGRTEAAIAAAESFERRFASDSRAPEVAVLRATLLCRLPQHRPRALAILNEVEAAHAADPALREQIHRARTRCDTEAAEAAPFSGPAPPGADRAPSSRGSD